MSFDTAPPVDLGRLRVLSHPLRLRLLEALGAAGPLTATEAAARVGSTPSNCSFHFRQLAQHGYVVEDAGSGRRRPWRAVDNRLDVRLDDLDADGRNAARQLVVAALDQLRQRALDWFARRDEQPPEWRDAVGTSHLMLDITASELRGLRDEIFALLEPYIASAEHRRTDGALPVAVVVSSLPAMGATYADPPPAPDGPDQRGPDHHDPSQSESEQR